MTSMVWIWNVLHKLMVVPSWWVYFARCGENFRRWGLIADSRSWGRAGFEDYEWLLPVLCFLSTIPSTSSHPCHVLLKHMGPSDHEPIPLKPGHQIDTSLSRCIIVHSGHTATAALVSLLPSGP